MIDPLPRTPAAPILLWLAGNGLRLTILAVPPVIAMIRDDLRLSATEVGLLSSIPPAMFAIAALGGSLLVARMGVTVALVGGLLLVAAGSALRGVAPNYPMLLAMTVVMSSGVAIMQPIMPTAVRQWLPQRIGFGTALYTNGLLVGEVLAVLLTAPVVLPLVGGDWRLSLVAWSVPIAVIAVAVRLFAPRSSAHATNRERQPQKWLPDWHAGRVWRLGALFCCVNAIYFSANAFLPIFLASKGRADLISHALLALNLGQLPASLLLVVVAAPPRPAGVDLCRVGRRVAGEPGRYRRLGRRRGDCLGRVARLLGCGRSHPGTVAAAVAVQAGRRCTNVRRHVHAELWRRRADRDCQRGAVGHERRARAGVRAARRVRVVAGRRGDPHAAAQGTGLTPCHLRRYSDR